MKGIKRGIAIALLGISLSIGTGCTTGDALSSPSFAAPSWAPPYASGVRYYYFPEMEVYYDAYSGDFIYWDGFGWSYSSRLPWAYRHYDLYGANIILLDTRVHDPWLYHHHYSGIYPGGQYYYGPRTNSARGHSSRVFDENESNTEPSSRPRAIDPSQRLPERSIQPRYQQQQPAINERPRIQNAPQQRSMPQSQPRIQQQPIQKSIPQRAPSSAPRQLPKPGGKG